MESADGQVSPTGESVAGLLARIGRQAALIGEYRDREVAQDAVIEALTPCPAPSTSTSTSTSSCASWPRSSPPPSGSACPATTPPPPPTPSSAASWTPPARSSTAATASPSRSTGVPTHPSSAEPTCPPTPPSPGGTDASSTSNSPNPRGRSTGAEIRANGGRWEDRSSTERRECAPDSSQGQVTQREIAAPSQRSRPPKPDPLGRLGQRKQGNAGGGPPSGPRRRASSWRSCSSMREPPAAPPAGDGISYLREGRLVRLGLGLRPGLGHGPMHEAP